MALCNNTAEAEPSTVVQAKRRTILEDWDKRRVVELGDEAGSWEVLYCSTGLSFVYFFFVSPSLSFISFNSIVLRSQDGTPICTSRRSDASSQM